MTASAPSAPRSAPPGNPRASPAARIRKWLSVGVLCAPLLGCGGTPGAERADGRASDSVPLAAGPSDEVASSPPSASADSLRDDLVQHGLRVPRGTRAEVRAALGPPDSAHAAPVPNRHVPAWTDTIVELFYPGLRLEYRVVGSGRGAEFLSHADVGENRYLKYPELGVGAPAAVVRRALGPPGERTDSTYVYDCGSCPGAESPVVFHLAGERVRLVRFTFYVD